MNGGEKVVMVGTDQGSAIQILTWGGQEGYMRKLRAFSYVVQTHMCQIVSQASGFSAVLGGKRVQEKGQFENSLKMKQIRLRNGAKKKKGAKVKGGILEDFSEEVILKFIPV